MSDPHSDLFDLPALFRAAAHGPDTREARRLSRAASKGSLVRVHTGVYCLAAEWEGLDDADRHRLRLRAAVPALGGRLVVSHGSALALHGLPTLGDWPDRVHVTDPEHANGHSERFVVKHGGPLDPADTVVVDGIRTTSILRTLTDVARTARFSSAVVSTDAALRREGVTAEGLRALLTKQCRRHGSAAAARVVDFASALSDSPGESWCRCRMRELGAPTPVLQHRFPELRGRVGPVDFWFADQGVVVEFDGDVKYLDARFRGGLSAEQVVLNERRRERGLLRLDDVRDVVRVDWRDLVEPWRLRRLLVAAGVPVR